ncbi:DUF3955 domain-containing protein [Inediibacterium massiliense]|uniref:DUF3955 domain-containing protein n=1 Tax=Inediibacterium massiliense TaxID=1658111 RepID=UPI0006B62CAB|nr:DUF3955 domain-containing protein [Inediibacterium massiliense]
MKKYLLSFISLIIGISCLVTYHIIGSEVAPDGTLLEPFFLIPISYFFIAIGIILGLVIGIVSFSRNHNKCD